MTGGGPVATQDHAFVLSCKGIGELLACRTNVNVLISHIAEVKEKIETLKEQMRRLELLKVEMLATPDQQISLTDPGARSMATSGRGSGVLSEMRRSTKRMLPRFPLESPAPSARSASLLLDTLAARARPLRRSAEFATCRHIGD